MVSLHLAGKCDLMDGTGATAEAHALVWRIVDHRDGRGTTEGSLWVSDCPFVLDQSSLYVLRMGDGTDLSIRLTAIGLPVPGDGRLEPQEASFIDAHHLIETPDEAE